MDKEIFPKQKRSLGKSKTNNIVTLIWHSNANCCDLFPRNGFVIQNITKAICDVGYRMT